jgi:hypothetical protein
MTYQIHPKIEARKMELHTGDSTSPPHLEGVAEISSRVYSTKRALILSISPMLYPWGSELIKTSPSGVASTY